MKSWIKIICSVSVITIMAPYAFAQQAQPTNPATPGAPLPPPVQAYNDYYRGGPPSGLGYGSNRNADGVYTLGGELFQPQQEEEKKIYRYDGKNRLLYGVELPRRSFNNIQYPY